MKPLFVSIAPVIISLLAIIFLSGCKANSIIVTPNQAAATLAQPSLTPTSIPSPTAPAPTFTPTFTLTSTPSPTSTPTPTPEKPVLAGTLLPPVNEKLTANNILSLVELKRFWGNPDAFSKISADRSRLVMGTVEGLLIYDVPTGSLLKRINTHPYLNHLTNWPPIYIYTFNQLALSADGSRIAYVDENGKIKVVSDQGVELLSLPMQDTSPADTTVDLSPDGKLLAYSARPLIWYNGAYYADPKRLEAQLIDVDQNKPVGLEKVILGRAPQFSGDGKFIIAENNPNSLEFISVLEHKLGGYIVLKSQGRISEWAADPHSTRVAAVSSGNLEVWDYFTNTLIQVIKLPTFLNSGNNVLSYDAVHFSSNGKFMVMLSRHASVFESQTQALSIDISSGQVKDKITSTTEIIYDVARMDALGDGTLTISRVGIDPASWQRGKAFHDRAWTSDLGFISTNNNSALQFTAFEWTENTTCRLEMQGSASCTQFATTMDYQHYFYNSGSLYYYQNSPGSTPMLEVYPTGFGSNLPLLEAPQVGQRDNSVLGLSARFMKLLYMGNVNDQIAGTYTEIHIFDGLSLKQVVSWKVVGDNIYPTGVVSADGRYAAMILDWKAANDQLMVYDLKDMSLVVNQTLKNSSTNLYPLIAMSLDNQVVAAVSSTWKMKPVASGYLLTLSVNVINLREPGKQASYNFQFDTPNLAYVFRQNGETALSTALSPDGSLLAVSCTDGQIDFIETASGKMLYQFQAHAEPILRIAFSPDGRLLASMGRSGIIKIWGN